MRKEDSGGTEQVLMMDVGLHALFREKEKILTTLVQESNCDYSFSSEMEEGMRLVSIVGRRDTIDEAAKKSLESW